jgi:hypothetical protein
MRNSFAAFDPRDCDFDTQQVLPVPLTNDIWDLSTKTLVDPSSITGRTINIVLDGQSTNNNSINGDTYVPPHADNIFNLSIDHRGAVFKAAIPLLVSDQIGGHHALRSANSLIEDGVVDNVVIAMIAQGSSFCADHCPGGGTIGASNPNNPNNVPRTGVLAYRIGLVQRCLFRAGVSHLPTILDWQQGEWDTDATATIQANYQAALAGVINQYKNVGLLRTGNVMFVNLCTRIEAAGGVTAARDAIRAAQAAVCDGVLVQQGADIDTLDVSLRDTSKTHFTPAGAGAQAALKVPFYESYLSGIDWSGVAPIG